MEFDWELPVALTAYGLPPESATLVSPKPARPVWRVATADGGAYLKRLPYRRARVLFVVGAGEYLYRKGAGVPKPLRTRAGEPYAAVGQVHYLLTEAASGRTPNYAQDLECIAKGLASFHSRSRGYTPPGDSERRDQTGAWLEGYRLKMDLLRAAAAEAASRGTAVGRVLSGYAAQALEEAGAGLANVEAIYRQVKPDASRKRLLCHQDFSPRNLSIDEAGRLVVFDLDGVAFNLPVRDLRELVNRVMTVKRKWEAALVRRITDAYTSVRPLSVLDYTVLLADFRFPHLLVRLARKLFLEPSPEWPEDECHRRLEAIVELERCKPPALEALAAAWGVAG